MRPQLAARTVKYLLIDVSGATAWADRRIFLVQGVELLTVRLRHIVESKAATGRNKDKLFLATHKDALEQLLNHPGDE